jgi:potassium-transporting ATPase KdpC subunit
MLALFRPAATLLVAFSILTGIAYPLLITVAAQALFPHQSNGSLIQADGRTIGSVLIGQEFTSPRYIWGRPSATAPAYNGGASTGSNLGPSYEALHEAVAARVEALHNTDPDNKEPVPVDLVTASASGLDPDISIAAAKYQSGRVARERGVEQARIEALIERLAHRPVVRGFGEPRVNVLALNLALDNE